MFTDVKLNPAPAMPPSEKPKALLGRKELFIVLGVAILIALGAGAWWFFSRPSEPTTQSQQPTSQEPITPELPATLDDINNEVTPTSVESPDLKGEKITFGAFYKPLNEPLEIKIQGVSLPLNIKSQVSNYYDTARKINLDPVIANLNQDGFATLDNPYPKVTNDFLGTYYELNQRGVPIVVTGDFLLYYYQNSLKQIYKDVESSYFYESLWRITKDLYETANGRYQERRQKLGVSSDALLEAERLEAAYFAVALTLLSPEKDQTNATEDLSNSKKFKPSEAKRFEFSAPGYLVDDLEKEIVLIKEARLNAKSPVLLYQRNYQEFKVSDEYKTTAKLHNFYLASRWYGSLFPIYFKDKDCTNCLLDREDWIINQTAAHLIANDLSRNQSLKNEWAKIYKVISFFSGLRSELTYLHYDNVRNEKYPKAGVEEVVSNDTFNHLISLRDGLAGLQFNPAEGSLSRQKAGDRPLLGMRLLQTAYWPSQSFYDVLTYDPVGNHKKPLVSVKEKAKYFTSCEGSGDTLYRCRGIGFDILAPLLADTVSSKFLTDNINYEQYAAQTNNLRSRLNSFNQVSWHNNNFWSTLYIARDFANEKSSSLPYTNSTRWLERKIGSSLATMTNLLLPADTWRIARDNQPSGLVTAGDLSSFNYIEPQQKLADELVANTKMLFDALISLGVVKDNDARFTDLLGKMTTSRQIIRKELSGQALDRNDYQFISDFVSQYRIDTTGSKNATINFYNPKTNKTLSTRQSVGPLKIMVLIYSKDNKKILALGPIFSYKEQ